MPSVDEPGADPRLDAAPDLEVTASGGRGRRRLRVPSRHWLGPALPGRPMGNVRLCGLTRRIDRSAQGTGSASRGLRGPPLRGGLRLLLAALLVLVLAEVLLRGVDSTVDLLVVLMVGVALGEPRYFVDPLVGLLRVLLGVGPRLLLQVTELAHAILLCPTGPGLPPGRVSCAPTPTAGTDAQAPSG